MLQRIGFLVVFGLLAATGGGAAENAGGPAPAATDSVHLLLADVPADGLVTAKVDLTAAARWCQRTPVAPGGVRLTTADGTAFSAQFIPDADFEATTRVAGTIVLRLPKAGPTQFRVQFGPAGEKPPVWDGTITTPNYVSSHAAQKSGGLPWKIVFPASGKTFEQMRWNNRLHHRERGSFSLCDDPQATVELVASGPLCHVVRVRGHYVQGRTRPASEPWATYDWYYFSEQPWVYVTATIGQRAPFTWHELHFLEMDYPREAFPRWAGGEPRTQGEFQDTKKSHSTPQWGLVHDGRNGIGMFQCGQILFYDAGPATYLQGQGDAAWQEWRDTEQRFSGWLWLGTQDDPARAVQAAAQTHVGTAQVTVTTESVRQALAAAARELDAAPPADRQRGQWRVAGAQQLEQDGRLAEAVAVARGQKPPAWTLATAGDLTLLLERHPDGIRLLQLLDAQTTQRLVSKRSAPLFTMVLRHAETKEEVLVRADREWGQTAIVAAESPAAAPAWELRWEQPSDKRLGNLRVVARLVSDGATQAFRWQLQAAGQAAPWSLWRVYFPEAAVADLGPRGCVFFPKASGEVQPGVWNRPFRFSGTYPSGWTSMQFMAAYREDLRSGLYLGVHDPWGSTKDLLCESQPHNQSLLLRYEHPLPDMGLPGNRFELSGEAVWGLLRGDWFDASVTYRTWVRQAAKWYPRLGADGRADTPQWMRELPAWALSGGLPASCLPPVKELKNFLGTPLGIHWYSWHVIPFDNDYPHYFPTQPGFADGVQDLQAAGVFVMPYINGRLWDTRDKGAEDFEFTRTARPAVSKDERGEPYVETYGSKEADGSPVRLGVMCPSTPLWQGKVREIVLKLMHDCHVRGVYIDQIAAAAPTLCFDKSHGHPLGGGHWWTEGYWQMLDALRKEMPPDRMLTTECNGEPYIRCMDGYLTWHWQYDGQVPAFSAVYGGAIQMFGRSYGGGETRHLALRMKAAQQLVFGEQLGWLNPGLALEKENAEFFKNLVLLRHQLRRYFYAGEMARPPKLLGTIPTVRADWQWNGVTWVTTDAVLTGAWLLPSEQRLVLLLINVSDQPVSGRLAYDPAAYGFDAGRLRVQKLAPLAPQEAATPANALPHEVTVPPRTAVVWELTLRQ